MSFPTDPPGGQIYNKYIYDNAIGAWLDNDVNYLDEIVLESNNPLPYVKLNPEFIHGAQDFTIILEANLNASAPYHTLISGSGATSVSGNDILLILQNQDSVTAYL